MKVSHWHGGQLVIVWVGLGLAVLVSFIIGVTLPDAWGAADKRDYFQAVQRWRAENGRLMDSINATAANDLDAMNRRAWATTRGVFPEFVDSVGYAANRRFEEKQRIVQWVFCVIIPLALLISGLVLTWQWFGYRSPRRDLQ